jgi:hypothetical protein
MRSLRRHRPLFSQTLEFGYLPRGMAHVHVEPMLQHPGGRTLPIRRVEVQLAIIAHMETESIRTGDFGMWIKLHIFTNLPPIATAIFWAA